VENFRIIRQVRLTFGRGLNVLFGPNDVGKSSLLDALRAAFLLPFTSKEGEDYIPWGNSAKPRVVVRFETGGAIWEITKEFGAGARGTAILERFGESGISLERMIGRAVEEKLRGIVAWGIPSGQRRGLSDTYLTTALLGRQDRVTEILAGNIENDGSGRELVTKALGEMAQDPLVTRLLKELERRCDEAFTPGGGWKRGGPVARRTREIDEQSKRLRELEKRVYESKTIELRVVSLTERINLANDECRLLQRRVERLQNLEEAEEVVSRLRASEEARLALESVENELAEREKAVEEATLALQKLEREERLAEERLAKASGALEEIRKGAQQTRDSRRIEITARRDKAAARAQLARDDIDAREQIRATDAALVEAKTERDSRQAQVANAETYWQTAQNDLGKAESILANTQKFATRSQILAAGSAPAKIAEQNASQTLTNTKAVIELSAKLVKAEEVLAQMLKEEQIVGADLESNATEKQRREAEGPRREPLSLGVILLTGLVGGITAGGLGTALQVRPILLILSIFGCAVLAGGLAALVLWLRDREKANRIWREEFNDLQTDRQGFVEKRNQIRLNLGIAQVQADTLRSQRDHLAASVGNVTLEEAQERHQEAKKQVERIESELRTIASSVIPVDEADSNLQLAKRAVSQSHQDLDEARNHLTKAQSRVEIVQAQLVDANSRYEQLTAKMGGRAAAQVLTEAEHEVEEVDRALKELEESPSWEVAAAEKEAEQAQMEATRLQAEVSAARTVRGAATEAQVQGRKKREEARVNYQTLLQSASAGKDVEAAEEALAQARRELGEVNAPSLPQNLEDTKALLTQRQAELRKAENELHVAEGELNQVGGIVAREQRDQEREALEQLENGAHELELEFGATKRLLEVLMEEEAKYGADLGRCFAKPVTEAFLQLTNISRYSQVAFEGALRVQHVAASGRNADWRSLSVGTRDQLAALIRLTLASQLKSVLVLDDQLAQSDPDRLVWFRDRLRTSVRDHGHQIIVITCRPLDYLRSEELPGSSSDQFESEDELLKVVDLRPVLS
jgi:recombinational DNA repair ATPase RecF